MYLVTIEDGESLPDDLASFDNEEEARKWAMKQKPPLGYKIKMYRCCEMPLTTKRQES